MIDMNFSFDIYGVSDKGNVRKENQDRVWFSSDKNGEAVCVVADGMGGYEDGAFASETVISAVNNFWVKSPDVERIGGIFRESHEIIRGHCSESGKTCGTTVSVLYVRDGRYYIAHVGDSRIYKMVGKVFKKIEQLTEDDTWVCREMKEGRLSVGEAKNHPKRHHLTNCIGAGESYTVAEIDGEIETGDIFVLCSDGFYNCVSDNDAKKIKVDSSEKMAREMLKKALKNGGEDNVSVIVLKVGGYG